MLVDTELRARLGARKGIRETFLDRGDVICGLPAHVGRRTSNTLTMKVLFISNDPTIFDAGSAARARMRAYAALIGELHIVSAADKNAREEQDGNLFLHPIHSWKLFRVRALALRAHALILEHDIEVVSAQDPFEHWTRSTACNIKIKRQNQNFTSKCILIFSPRGL